MVKITMARRPARGLKLDDVDLEPTMNTPDPPSDRTNDSNAPAGVGASDGTNGGGAGSGIPDGETALRAGDAVTGGDVQEDKKKLFPDAGKSSARK